MQQCEKEVQRSLAGKKMGREKCNLPAHLYEVKGASFIARAKLCDHHKLLATREGFKLKPIQGEA